MCDVGDPSGCMRMFYLVSCIGRGGGPGVVVIVGY